MLNSIHTRLTTYVRSHPAEVRTLCFILAFAIVWSQADHIQSFATGFFDAVAEARQL